MKHSSLDQANDFEKPFLEEQVKNVIFAMDNSKASERNGFSMLFYQECWDTIKGDLMKVFSKFFYRGITSKAMRSTFLVLIPKKGFGNKWISLMKGCVIEPFFSMSVNGTSKGFFKFIRGLRQGDPLSPFLFSLVADGLTVILKIVEEKALLEGSIIGHDRIMVSHSNWKMITIFFLKADRDNTSKMELCMIFQAIFGLKVNLSKSCMVGIHVEGNRFSSLADVMGCNVGDAASLAWLDKAYPIWRPKPKFKRF